MADIYWIGGARCSFRRGDKQSARRMGLPVIRLDGRLPIEETTALVEEALHLAE